MTPLRLALIGTSDIVRRAITRPLYRIPSAEIVLAAVVGRNPEKTAVFAEANRIPFWSTSIEEVLTNGSVDAAYLALPNALHAAVARQSLQSNIHVLIEKPICLSLAEWQLVRGAVGKSALVAEEAVMLSNHPWVSYLKSLETTYGSIKGSHTTLWFNPDSARLERMPTSRQGGGIFFDVVSYWLFLVQETVGLDLKGYSLRVLNAEDGRDMQIHAEARFSSGKVATLDAGYGRSLAHFEVTYAHGSARVGNLLRPAIGQAGLFAESQGQGTTRRTAFPAMNYYESQLVAFVNKCRGGQGTLIKPISDRMRVMDLFAELLYGQMEPSTTPARSSV